MALAKVTIGIQARSTSTRFPRKVFELIDGKPMLKHVLEICEKSASYMNHHSQKSGISVSVSVVTPFNDEIASALRFRANIVQGPEQDVLTRFMKLFEFEPPDYLVRVTADCPLIPPFLISKAITVAVKNNLDYCSNVDEFVRTAVDGFDVEVISKRAMMWADLNATERGHREHVTSILRSQLIPKDFKIGFIVGYLDQSDLKLSVDTPEDLERVRAEYEKIRKKTKMAEEIHGKGSVHRF